MIDNEVVGVVSMFQDISEYGKIITELQGFQKLNEGLEAEIESSHYGLVVADHNGEILMQNRSYERLTGLVRKDCRLEEVSDNLRLLKKHLPPYMSIS